MEPDLVLVDAATADFELLELGTVTLELNDRVATCDFETVFPGTIELELIPWP
jgi:hypothetical protein